jgi:hypothetical protein
MGYNRHESTNTPYPIVRRKEEERWGEPGVSLVEPYRTKRLVLEAFESLKHGGTLRALKMRMWASRCALGERA